MVHLRDLGIAHRSAWARKAGVSASLLCFILQGKKVLTPDVRRRLALAAGIVEDDVPKYLASTRTAVRS